jgi:hypothetical protein
VCSDSGRQSKQPVGTRSMGSKPKTVIRYLGELASKTSSAARNRCARHACSMFGVTNMINGSASTVVASPGLAVWLTYQA